MALAAGLQASVQVTVADSDTAVVAGSGDVPVLATPRLLALAEAATVAAVAGHLEPGQTSVGTRVQLEHLRASAVGAKVTVQAQLAHVDGRLLRFEVTAEDSDGQLVGHGQVTRVVVDRDRFLSRL
jgi:fluoroacetyl-CoA thioesterase